MTDQPPEKPTAKFEPPPKWAQDGFERMHARMEAGFSAAEARIGEVESKVDTAIHGLGTVTDEVNVMKKDLYEFKGETKARMDAGSMRARAESVHDEAQDQKIAQLSESQIAAMIKDAVKTPLGKKVLVAFAGLVLVAINAGTVYLMRPAPQPTQIQVTK